MRVAAKAAACYARTVASKSNSRLDCECARLQAGGVSHQVAAHRPTRCNAGALTKAPIYVIHIYISTHIRASLLYQHALFEFNVTFIVRSTMDMLYII